MNPLTLSIPIIAVTGSAGKTTTKEMISSVLSMNWNIFKSKETRNQIRHTQKSTKRIHSGHQAVVLEMGMGRKNAGQIHCSFIQPSIAVITNVGAAHYGKLGNNILRTAEAKSALIRYMKPDGLLLINRDDDNSRLLQTDAFRGQIITVGINNHADYQAKDVKYLDTGMIFKLVLNGMPEEFIIPVFGFNNVINALFAIAIGHRLKFSPADIRQGLKKFIVPKARLNLIPLQNDSLLIDDTYNSNPDAVKAATDVLLEVGKGKSKVVVLGSMLELGRYSAQGHGEVGRYLAETGIDVICSYGRKAEFINIGAVCAGHKHVKHFLNKDEMHNWLKHNIKPATAILVKGSNRMKMGETVSYLEQQFSNNSWF